MTSEFSGAIRGNPDGRAVRLAGVLAELGIQKLVLTSPNGSVRDLNSRETDLPGVLAISLQGAVLAHSESGLLVRIEADGFYWSVPDPAFTRALIRISD